VPFRPAVRKNVAKDTHADEVRKLAHQKEAIGKDKNISQKRKKKKM
jgi:hypothetical protein